MATSVSLGGMHACSVMDNGSVYCWGANSNGQLGDGTTTDSSVPVLVGIPGSMGALSVSSGLQHACAVLENGSVYCWGELLEAWDNSQPIVEFPNLGNVISVTTANAHSCAILDDGTAYCWGDNTWGQLGIVSGSDNKV